MEFSNSTSIQDLPVEIFHVIAQFLNRNDIDACFNVCQSWRCMFNSDKIWRRCCIYEEKYFKTVPEHHSKLAIGECTNLQDSPIWRKYFEHQQRVWENWSKGRYEVENTGIPVSKFSLDSVDYVDDYGNHWLFYCGEKGILIWNFTEVPAVFHSFINQTDQIGIYPVTDKLLAFRSNYVKVFQFKYPEYSSSLLYRFKFNMNDILPDDEIVPDDEYMCSVRHIIVDNFFVGYCENVTNICTAFLHIWDLDSAKKIATQTVFQQSYVNFILSKTGIDIIEEFHGGLLLFKGDSGRFLVNLIDDKFKLCQISLFDISEMRFSNVIARLMSYTAWCEMKGDVIVIYHKCSNKSQISVYNVKGQFLAELKFPGQYNPMFSNEFWFSGSKIILKVGTRLHVMTISDSSKVHTNIFNITKGQYILTYTDPKFLLLFYKQKRKDYSNVLSSSCYCQVSIWDVESGLELWTLDSLAYAGLRCFFWPRYIKYPGKVMVQFQGDTTISVLNFEKGAI